MNQDIKEKWQHDLEGVILPFINEYGLDKVQKAYDELLADWRQIEEDHLWDMVRDE